MQPSLTDTPAASQWTETLANLNILWILGIIAVLSVLRFALVRSKFDAAHSWSEMLESGMIAVALVFLIIRPFVLQAFFIPSASMEPTLLGNNGTGDRILVNKFGYRFSSPQHDDVVVFLAPPAATVPDGLAPDSDFIKRLIGMPGDHLEVVGGVVYVDGQPHNHADVRQALARAGEFGPEAQAAGYVSQADHHVKFAPDGVLADTHLVSLSRLGAILTNTPNAKVLVEPGYVIRDGQKLNEPFIGEDPDYDMKMWQGEPLKRAHGEVDDTTYQNVYLLAYQPISSAQFQADWSHPTGTVPAGNYMMMGDNRNDSSDGTNWGPLESHRVVGRAQFIFWPPSRIGVIH
ncbi:MAG: signal peptidase I [Janthinobacterium lividum]